MNIFQRVTLQSLKKNRTRTVVTIIGIMLSAALICAVTTSVSSLVNYAVQNVIYVNGSWHGSDIGSDYGKFRTIAEDSRVKDAVCSQYIGYAEAKGCTNEYKPYLYLMGASDGFYDTMSVHLISGEYPDAEDEILLPEHLASNGGVTYKMGDRITLEVGDRIMDGETAFPLYQNNPSYFYDESGDTVLNNEEIVVRETKSYTVVGFYERPEFEEHTAPGFTAITVLSGEPESDAPCDIYFTMKHAQDVYDFMEEHHILSATNYELLMFSGVSRYESFGSVLYGLAAVVIGLIMFGSVSLIYNAFSISVSERTKQFGLLSSIGATRKQLRHMVFYEALVVSVIGIPLGILVGITGIGITLQLIGDKFSSLSGFPIPMRICVSPAAIVTACIVALVTVLISAWIPSRRATRITAVEAIRQTSDIKGKNKPVRTPKLVYKLFGLPGMLAHKQFKRSRKKYRATVVSLFMSIVLFVTSSAFTSYLTQSVEDSFGTMGFDLRYSETSDNMNNNTPDDLLTRIEDNEHVKKVTYAQQHHYLCSIPAAELQTEAAAQLNIENAETADLHCTVFFVEDQAFRELLQQQHLDEADFMNPEKPLALVYDTITAFDSEKEKFRTLQFLNKDRCTLSLTTEKAFEGYYYDGYSYDTATDSYEVVYVSETDPEDSFTIPEEEAYETTEMQTGKILDEPPYFVEYTYSTLTLLYPMSIQDEVIGTRGHHYNYNYYIVAPDHKACYTSLKQMLVENGLDAEALYDYAENVEETRNIILIIKVFSYGFIVLISLIAAANVFNTISTNIILRRREFAMLKSVGMTDRGFQRMMHYECLLYGTRALLFGLPVSAALTYLIYRSVLEGFETSYYLPWGAIGISVLSVFLVVFATMLYAMSKIRKDNPIDALKNENL